MCKPVFIIFLLFIVLLPCYSDWQKSIYKYDPNGNQIEEYTTYSSNSWSKKVWQYDDQGNLLFQSHEISKGLVFKQENKFDENNNIIYSYYETPEYWIKDTWTYDHKGNELTNDHTISSGNHTAIRRKYNSLNQLISEETEYFGEKARIILTNFIYNPQGLLAEKNTSGWITKYAYNQQNQIISEIQTDSKNYVKYTIEYTYDDKGNLIEYYSKRDIHWTKITYIYDDKQQLIEETETQDGGSLNQKKYKYDQRGNTIEFYEFSKYRENENWFKTTWQYDNNNRIIKEVYECKSGSISTQEITYNNKGLIIKENFYGSSKEWAVYTYTYNEADQLIKKYTESSQSGSS